MEKNKKTQKTMIVYDWDTAPGKREIVFAIFDWLQQHPTRVDEYRNCANTRTITENEILQTKIPANRDIFCFRKGDESLGPLRKEYSSLILEIPPDTTLESGGTELLRYACTYNLWAGLLREQKRLRMRRTRGGRKSRRPNGSKRGPK